MFFYNFIKFLNILYKKMLINKHTTTSEGSSVTLDAMVFWRIVDTQIAA